jgi:hypothetical protein
MIDGQQFRFWLDGVWRSQVMPTRGLVVEVDLDHSLQITGMAAVPESQVGRAQAELAILDNSPSESTAGPQTPRFLASAFIASGLLLVGWFFLTTISIAIPVVGKVDLTFWQLLGLLNTPDAFDAVDRANLSAGIYSVFAAIVLTGPFLQHFWKDRRALLAGVAPLLFMIMIGIAAHSRVRQAFVPGAYPQVGGLGVLNGISFGFGAYLTAMIGAYFAFTGVRQFALARAVQRHQPEKSRPAAA